MQAMTANHGDGLSHRLGGRLLAAALALLFFAASACTPEKPVPEAPQPGAADVSALIDAGAYDEALRMLASAQLTPEERAALVLARYLAMARDAEAAEDYSAAYGLYMSAGTAAAARDGAARCYAAIEMNKARALFDRNDIYGAFAVLDAFGDRAYAADAQALRAEMERQKAEKLTSLYEQYRDRLAAGAWYTAMLGTEPLLTGDARYDLAALPQDADAVYGGTFGLFYRKDGRLTVYADTMGAQDAIEGFTGVTGCAIAQNHALILTDDGLVHTVGSVAMEKGLTAEWSDIVGVAAGAYHSVGLRADGTLVATGSDAYAQCQVSEWTDVTSIAAGMYHTVGLKADGTCVATGDNAYGQCDVSEWRDVLAVYCGATHTVALTKDFTVLAAGNNGSGQCEVSDWSDIVAVSCGAWHTVGVRADGRLAVSGADSNGQCQVASWRMADLTESPDPAPMRTDGSADELVYYGEFQFGPWSYLYQTGAVMICFDQNEVRVPLRSDLYAAAGSTLYGGFADGKEKPGAAYLPAKLCRGNDAVFGITGDYINFNYNPDGVQLRRGQIYREGGPQESFAFFPDGTMRLIDPQTTTAQELLDAGVRDSWAFGPVLVRDGAAENDTEHFLADGLSPRCAIGMISPYHFISVVSGWGGQLRIPQLTDIFLHYGTEVAYNMDGGNSTSVVFMGEMLNYVAYVANVGYGIRRLCDMVMFLQSDLVPDVDAYYKMNKFIAKGP